MIPILFPLLLVVGTLLGGKKWFQNRSEVSPDIVKSPLHWASHQGDLRRVKSLLLEEDEMMVRIDTVTKQEGLTPLHVASQRGKEKVVEFLLNNGANASARNFVGETPLHLASATGQLGVVRKLIGYTTDGNDLIHIQTTSGETPLFYACSEGRLGVVKLLLQRGADLHTSSKKGWTLLHAASANGRWDVARFLIKSGLPLDTTNIDGEAPLHLASRNGHLRVVKLLVAQGSSVRTQCNFGWTPLHKACAKGKTRVVKFLVNHAGREIVDLQCNAGWTPLHEAARTGDLEAVKYLVAKGSNINARTFDGKTPLDCTKSNEVAAFLKRKMAGIATK